MIIIPFACLGAVCLIMSIVYTMFNNKKGWQGLLVKCLTMFSLFLFALISANLKSIINAIALYIPVAFVVLIVSECLSCMDIDEKVKTIFSGVIKIASFALIAISAMSLAEFNILALIGGLLLGVGLGLISWAKNKYKNLYVILIEIFNFMAICAIIGLGINAVLRSSHFISSILLLVAGVVLLVVKLMRVYGKNNKIVNIIANELYILALIVIGCSIYFF